jgi:hypothetical protein
MKKFVYDYYDVYVPNDCFDTEEQEANYAIDFAKDNAKLYCIPCKWEATHVPERDNSMDNCYHVRRKRHYIPSTRHYHVLCGLQGGYMPDSNDVCSTLTEAYAIARDLKSLFTDDIDENNKPMWYVYGDIRKDHQYRIESRTSETHLGYIISINECFEDDCQEEA